MNDYTEATVRRDAGIERAVTHADRVMLTWSDDAYSYLRTWLARKPRGDFLAEDAFAEFLIDPPDGRAFGAVIRRAARDGLIHKVGYRQAKTSNLSPKVLWRSA